MDRVIGDLSRDHISELTADLELADQLHVLL